MTSNRARQLLALGPILFAACADAAPFIWTAPAGDWDTPALWSTGYVPDAPLFEVQIGNGVDPAEVTISKGDYNVWDLVIMPNATVSVPEVATYYSRRVGMSHDLRIDGTLHLVDSNPTEQIGAWFEFSSGNPNRLYGAGQIQCDPGTSLGFSTVNNSMPASYELDTALDRADLHLTGIDHRANLTAASSTLTLTSTSNNGTVTITDSQVHLVNVTNHGSLSLSGGSLFLSMANTAMLRGIQLRDHVQVRLDGPLDNTGDELVIDGELGDFGFAPGGKLIGGSVHVALGRALNLNNASLENVVISGDAIVDGTDSGYGGANTTLYGNNVYNGTLRLRNDANVGFYPITDQTLTGSGSLIADSGKVHITTTWAGKVDNYLDIAASGSGTELWIQSQNQFSNHAAIDVSAGAYFRMERSTNAGTITAENCSMTLGEITNSGTITATDSIVYLWDVANTGMIDLTRGSLTMESNYTTADLLAINRHGDVKLTLGGVLDNTGRTLAIDDSTGDVELSGWVTGGNIAIAPGHRIRAQFDSRLASTTVQGQVSISNTRMRIGGTVVMDGIFSLQNGKLFTDRSSRLTGSGQIHLEGSNVISGEVDGLAITGSGKLSIWDANAGLGKPPLPFRATLAPGDGAGAGAGIGTITLESEVPLNALALEMELAGPGQADLLVLATGTNLDAGQTSLHFTGGTLGETYQFLSCDTGWLTGQFAFSQPGYELSYSGRGVSVTVVPEPTLLAPLGLLCLLLRRSRMQG